MRRETSEESTRARSVSIHAPWEGCDTNKLFSPRAQKVSIHAPWEGCDFLVERKINFNDLFQFTHPGKGATKQNIAVTQSETSFNSRTLGRVRQRTIIIASADSMFQFTHPGKGATTDEARASACDAVSIHAPWEGCDSSASYGGCTSPRFNSRTLGRVRPVRLAFDIDDALFQFTHPGKGATSK